MNWSSLNFDWNQARAFLATAEEGSLSAAAKALGLTQPTLSRQVAGLEEELGVTLFERVGRSLALTDAGREVLAHFKAMGAAAGRASLAASGQSQDVKGKVSITSTSVFAMLYLPPILKKIRQAAPGVELTVITSNTVQDLMRREADISIRHARPEQPDLIGKLVGETAARLYASTEYLDRKGRPETVEDLKQHDFVGFDSPEYFVPALNSMGVPVTRENFKLNTASGPLFLALVRQGMGVTVLTDDVVGFAPELEPVLPDFTPMPIPVWLVTHRELHTSRRIRVVFDILAAELPSLPRSNRFASAMARPLTQ